MVPTNISSHKAESNYYGQKKNNNLILSYTLMQAQSKFTYFSFEGIFRIHRQILIFTELRSGFIPKFQNFLKGCQ